MIIISTGSLYHFGLAHIFEIVDKSGFKGIELMLRPFGEDGYADSWNIEYLKHLQEKHKVKIVSIHPPVDFEERADFYFDKIIDLSKKLKVNQIVIHIPKKQYLDYIKWFAKFKPSDNHKIKFLFENMGAKAIYQGTDRYKEYPNFCYDIGHALKAGDDPKKELIVLSNVKQLHISAFDGKECHMSIKTNQSTIINLLSLQPNAIRCLELCPGAFFDPNNGKEIINELKINRGILESI